MDGLRRYPILNSSVSGDNIVYKKDIHMGIAVALEWGLIVPVIRHADEKSFLGLTRAMNDLADRARAKKLSVDEVQGGTFTITNPGVYGGLFATPIINPPQSAILGIHATKERAVVEGGQVVVRPMNYFALSYDHRIIDGREAVLSLVAMKDALEDPVRLLLEL